MPMKSRLEVYINCMLACELDFYYNKLRRYPYNKQYRTYYAKTIVPKANEIRISRGIE